MVMAGDGDGDLGGTFGADQVSLVEVSPRDGLQNESTLVSTADKVSLILRAAQAGARRIEAVSFVNPARVPQMADAEAVMAQLADTSLRHDGVSLAGLVLNRRGMDRALRAGVDELNFVVIASETFNRRNQGVDVEETLAQLVDIAQIAGAESKHLTVTIGASFGCPFEGEVTEAQVERLIAAAAAVSAQEIALADTIGVADPLAVRRRLELARRLAPSAQLRCHFHNTRNTGLANAYAAWQAGVAVLDTSIGGIGGCPFAPLATGNIPTEDTVYMFERMGVQTGFDLASLVETTRWLGEVLGAETPGLVARAGPFPTPTGPA
jgi:hydroxymethylglutaryl-CoA lyase